MSARLNLRRAPTALWLLLLLGGSVSAVQAAEENCLLCHGTEDFTDSAGRSLYVDEQQYSASVHGQMNFPCSICHADAVSEDIHPTPLENVYCGACHADAAQEHAGSIHATVNTGCADCHGKHDILPVNDEESRTNILIRHETCGRCHFRGLRGAKSEKVVGFLESVHARALRESGLTVSATCTSCHGAHRVVLVSNPNSKVSHGQIPTTCGQCHAGILQNYLRGVHGSNFAAGVEDVPVCTTCHGEHAIIEPERWESRVYRTKVARVCAECHDNETLMTLYGIPANRLRSFGDSIHGIALAFGSTRVPNCASCHGFHDIFPSEDVRSSVHSDNIPRTCGQCHAGAGTQFAEGKLHLVNLREENFAAFLVRRAYQLLIFGLLAAFLVYIGADLWNWWRTRKSLRPFGPSGEEKK